MVPRAPGVVGDDDSFDRRPALVVGTKLDLAAADAGAELLRLELLSPELDAPGADRVGGFGGHQAASGGGLPLVLMSALSGAGLADLQARIVEALNVVRVYAKPPGRPADLTRPFVLRRGATVEDLAAAVHHELREKLQHAVRWPDGGAPLRVAHQHELRDRDVIELHAG